MRTVRTILVAATASAVEHARWLENRFGDAPMTLLSRRLIKHDLARDLLPL